MSFLRPLRVQFVIRPHRISPVALRVRPASGYGDPSDDAHPATAKPQEQGSGTQEKQAEHPGPRDNEPSKQGGSSYGDKGGKTKAAAPPTDTGKATETSWSGGNNVGGSRVHGKGKQETKLGGSLSGNKDHGVIEVERSGPGRGNREESNQQSIGRRSATDPKGVGGKDDSRKHS
jgi:hypothetical protein